MTPEEYANRQALIVAAVGVYVAQFSSFFSTPSLPLAQWLQLLQLLFPEVERRRTESAVLSRQFYDSQRLAAYPTVPRQDVLLEPYDFRTFVVNMEPAREKMSLAESPKNAVTSMVLRATREVENAGRQQIINAVEQDTELFVEVERQQVTVEPPQQVRVERQVVEPQPVSARRLPTQQVSGSRWVDPSEAEVTSRAADIRDALQRELDALTPAPVKRPERDPGAQIVRGWARVATGKETCGWCLMLISRGATYMDSRQAGLKLVGWAAAAKIAAGEDVSSYMKEWHDGCDCKVVPVYDLQNWPGKEAADRALELYKDAGPDAEAWRELYPDRVHLTGKNKGQPFTKNEDIVLALRRKLESGEISTQEYAALAA